VDSSGNGNSHLLQVEIQTRREAEAKKWSRKENGTKGGQFTNLDKSFRRRNVRESSRSEALEYYHSYSLRSGYGPSSFPFSSEGLNITVSVVIISIGS
jgi:hypothetical protein